MRRWTLAIAIPMPVILAATRRGPRSSRPTSRSAPGPFLSLLNLLLVLNWLLFAVIAIDRATTGQTFTYT